jgi:hypothetical protein
VETRKATIAKDQHFREGVTLDDMAKLPASFVKGGHKIISTPGSNLKEY